MAPQSTQNIPGNGGTVTAAPTRRRRGPNKRTRMTRSGAATGGMTLTSSTTPLNPGNAADYDTFGANVSGIITGFAWARGVTPQQALAGIRKHLSAL